MGATVQTETVPTGLTSMKGFTSPLWPIRYKPLPDELLSSWLVRLAHGHGLKVQTFCNLIFGNRLQVWNRDVDRLGPDWLVNELSARTGTPLVIAYGTTLRAYEGLLYPQFKPSGVLQWILTHEKPKSREDQAGTSVGAMRKPRAAARRLSAATLRWRCCSS